MRSTDIHIEWNDSRDRTENMYLPSQVPVEEMSLSEARRGLCARAMGSTAACRSGCGAGCRFGRRVMELEDAEATGEASPREQRKQLPVPEQTKRAEPPTKQQAAPVKTARRERPREEKWRYQAGLLIRRQGRVDMGPEPDGRRDGDGQGHPGRGVCVQERLSPGGEKNGRGAGTAWA